MARLKEIDPSEIRDMIARHRRDEAIGVILRHILALERAHNMREACRAVDETLKHIPVVRQEPERILPNEWDLHQICMENTWTREALAHCQQATVEAVCRWLENYAGKHWWTMGVVSSICEILHADAERVVQEARREE